MPYHQYHKDIPGKIMWDGKMQDLVYIHFSNFTVDFDSMTYKVGPRHGINRVDSIPWLASMCEEYFYAIKENI
jgi:hypothetical protein